MKKLLIGLLLFGSFSVFASDPLEVSLSESNEKIRVVYDIHGEENPLKLFLWINESDAPFLPSFEEGQILGTANDFTSL